MQVIILAAGEGTRLRPHTDKKPKCLVELCNKSIIERMIEKLISADVKSEDIHIVTGYMSHALEFLPVHKIHNAKYNQTNMVYSLFCAEDVLKSGEDVLILYGDIIISTETLKSALNQMKAISVISNNAWERLWHARMDNPLEDLESFKINKDKKLIEIGKKASQYEEIEGQFTGIIKFRKDITLSIIDFYRKLQSENVGASMQFNNMYMTDFLQLMIEHSYDLYVSEIQGGWLEIDTVQDLNVYNKMQAESTLAELCQI
tara:strand:- start:20 stop:799 length:780 start_codon:yes stop_codon:yes gene_type:complete